ncbi:MAG: hypothetical protein J5917_00325 [Bacteroidales bacterium]|nr:hypothetical protein [Bacteroidales bacterium]
MKTEKELYLAPTAETLKLMGPQQILAGSTGLESNVDPLDILSDDFMNWGGLI